MTRPFRSAPPKASAMLESLRGLGYSPETAIADTIDNSVSAFAKNVELIFKWDGKRSYVAIVDDGRGMSSDALDSAMRLGDRNPLQQRGAGDLGRFGLGLKTAAFSQGRRLTVLSRDSFLHSSCLSWDLDVLDQASDGDWRLLEGPDEESQHILALLSPGKPGTLVIWEVLDRLVPPGTSQQDFLDTIDRVERHLSMVFHRFLEGLRPRLKLTVNGKAVQAWNPFFASANAAPWSSPLEYLNNGTSECSVQCFVLPHRDRLTKTEFDSAAGVSGWNAQQGFYVYRNERLLVAGSWLGLGSPRMWTKDEVHRLARIRLDFTNDSDSDWKIDIRKSIAKPPHGIRQRLTSLGEDTRRRARAVFAHRGTVPRRPSEEPLFEAWESVVSAGVTRYKVNRNHPAVRSVLDSPLAIDGEVDVMLSLLESTIPVQRIWLDTVEERTAPHTEADGDEATVSKMLDVVYRSLLKQQYSSDRAKERLLRTEPFQRYPKLVANLAPMNEGSIEDA